MVGTPTEQGSAVSPTAPRIGTGEQRDFDPETIMISAVPEGPNKRYEGKMLTEIAASRGIDAVDAALDLLQQEGGGVQMIIFGMSEDDVRRVMRHSAVAVASDGWTLDPAAGGKPHPRSYGAYARVLGHYVREEGGADPGRGGTQDDIAPREAPAAARSWAREPGVHRKSRALRSGSDRRPGHI